VSSSFVFPQEQKGGKLRKMNGLAIETFFLNNRLQYLTQEKENKTNHGSCHFRHEKSC
jgi:hypothetical protein